MADYNLKFSAVEDVRLPHKMDSEAIIFDLSGARHPSTKTVTPNIDLKHFHLPAGELANGHYTYAITKIYDGVKKIIQSGRLEIYSGAAPKTDDEKEFDAINDVLLGDDGDLKEIRLPDGRAFVFSDREQMRIRKDELRHRIEYGKNTLRGTQYV